MANDQLPAAYLAGPTLFWPDAEARGLTLSSLCRAHGLKGVFPLNIMRSNFRHTEPSAFDIFTLNVELLNKCDLLIVDISPFRGPHVDDGTAFEIGLAYAKGKPIFAYTSDFTPLATRIPSRRGSDGKLRDENKIEVEDFGFCHNLMLVGAIISIHTCADAAIEAAAQHYKRRY